MESTLSNRHIPEKIKRALKEEAGYRCAVPTCRDKGPFDFEHIDDWAKVKEHKFHNMILLCVGCHARVTRKEIHKDAIRAYKRNLAIISGRYSILEVRLLEWFWENRPLSRETKANVSTTDKLHLKGLIDDNFIRFELGGGIKVSDGKKLRHVGVGVLNVFLTETGLEFVPKFFSGEKID